jgi:uncharacterized protein (UPF0147 family)
MGKQIVVKNATPRNVLKALNEAIEKETDPVEKARLQAKMRAALLKKP